MMLAGWILTLLPVVTGFYTYVGYPALLWAMTRGRRAELPPPAEWPLVSIVVPAYNEERQIAGAIEALLAQDYPSDRRQILILSDASSDGTDNIVRSYAERGVELLRMPVRGGKTAAENASCALIRGDIVVNTDASIRLLPAAVRHLVSAMGDPLVGVASGRDVSVAPEGTRANAAEGGYVGYEMWVRSLETRAGGIVGASGSGYAIRRTLHEKPIPADLSRDFSAALTAKRHGFSAVSVDGALCLVPRTASLQREYRRKVRTISRGMDTLRYQRDLLDLSRHPLFAWKLFSHKVCRWVLPGTVVAGMFGLALLATAYAWAGVLLALGVLTGLTAGAGFLWPANRPLPRVLSVLSFGVAANIAVLNAWWRVGRPHADHIWEPTRR